MTKHELEVALSDADASGLWQAIRRIRILDAGADSGSNDKPNVEQDVRRKTEYFRQRLMEQGWSDPCSSFAWSVEEGEFVLASADSAESACVLGAAIIYDDLSNTDGALSDPWFFARLIIEGTAFLRETGNARDLALVRFYTNLTLWETQRAHAKKALAGRKSLEGAAAGRAELSRKRRGLTKAYLEKMRVLIKNEGKPVTVAADIVALEASEGPGKLAISSEALRKLWYRHRPKL